MLSIQDVGTQILTGNPKSFYVFTGEEYGIKKQYIEKLKEHYNGNYVESPNVNSILSMMNRKQIVPLIPKLYVVRYDDEFISSLSDNLEKTIQSLNIVGTIVCIYENDKQAAKIDKYIPNYSVRLDKVSPQFVFKYLKSDFPNVPDNLIEICVKSTNNYSQAQNMCRSISKDVEDISKLDDTTILNIFGTTNLSTTSQIRIGVAARNFKYLMSILNSYSGSYDEIFYTMLSTMLELEKLYCNKHAQSDIKPYIDRWTLPDIYYFFNHVYSELKKSRSYTYDGKLGLIYLSSLLAFNSIPSKEALS